ncbi:MAG: sodium:glutamate symporter, partial [Verrucomicrobia bacterium]|nr:sodium:glutamate symporter [Verrucomicrobiota bacterium]
MLSFGCLCVLLGLGYWVRRKLVFLQKLFLPASVIAGLLGLFVFQLANGTGHPVPATVSRGWSDLPSALINIVFACLFLGTALPKVSKVWKSCSRQLAYGQIVAWGQYAVGCFFVLLLLGPIFGLDDIFAGIMPVGFEGGHGTAGGMKETFDRLGYPELKDYALASATGGIMGAIIVGMGLVNWAIRKGYVEKRIANSESEISNVEGGSKRSTDSSVIELLSLHLVFVGAAILLGWLMKQGMLQLAQFLPESGEQILTSFPLFPLCMLGGVIIQFLADRFDRDEHMDHGLMLRIQNCALDFL